MPSLIENDIPGVINREGTSALFICSGLDAVIVGPSAATGECRPGSGCPRRVAA